MTRHPLTIDGAVEVAVVERCGFDESRHYGAGVVIDGDGHVLAGVGDRSASVFPRSTLKPFQALAIRRSGARFDGAHYALTAASHAGTPAHQDAVASMLNAYGNTAEDLGCPPAFPLDPASARATTAPSRLAMECSGKHAGLLGACRVNEWDLTTYLDFEHPVQAAVVRETQDASSEVVDVIGVDGCGTPVFPITLEGLARGVARLVTSADADARELVSAALEHPWAVDGPGRPNAIIIDRLQIFAKLGTEGMMLMGVPGLAGVAVKVLDGNLRAATLTALHLLVTAGLVDPDRAEAVVGAVTAPITGRGKTVGRIRVGAGLG